MSSCCWAWIHRQSGEKKEIDIAQNKTSENTARAPALCARMETDGYICFIPMETRRAEYMYACVPYRKYPQKKQKPNRVPKPHVLAVVLFALPEVNEHFPFLEHWQPDFLLIFSTQEAHASLPEHDPIFS